ncbi:undecaprenyl-phosphate glucose phosphotransferase [Suipraeoptans intestinalis]|uniref:Undecaprenyl-phosphate glucose phosphotransferase n=1 Tax=Suipraeoptans intestinalis TaxID=2606628 RepID=A0A6N7V1B1_9FIRM|nr:undecaprenyl-phosphate glucose phosphotransferase [Suipraeoptans intestinalis]MDD7770172.1 undecaprenyl-phosphate glucose phosphotransferase [Suipraeoptans intestinalis]MDY3122323.1 undecaprenyl-phosphate glucose phosphotransferase [Suipraeoptans intestinalis]MSR93082.1 undecaprenyl-phosphate glucose phosphotransferase [Suipraeoptans intestinalis]
MIKDNQKLLNRLHVVLDGIVIVFSYISAWYLRFKSGIFQLDPWFFSLKEYAKILVAIVPVYLLLYFLFQLYTPKRVQGRRLEAWNIIQANGIGLLLFILGLYLLKYSDISRTMIFIFFCVNVFVEITVRNLIREGLRDLRRKGYNQKHILVIGYSRAAEQYIDRIKANPEWGYIIRGILADNVPRGGEYKGVKVLGRTENLQVVLPENKLDEIAIALGLAEYHKLAHIVGMCEKSGVHTKFIPDYNNIIPTKPYTEDLQGLPVINIRRVPLSNPFNGFMKRIVDIFGALVALILFSPIMLAVAVIIKVTSPGPLIFKQVRIGLQNRPFPMYKFRSMVVQEASAEKAGWTVKNDPRVTPIGRFIRKTSIDEFPQFINVLKGDMSLVGPRPERPQFVEKFKEEIPRYMIKHQVRPGLTGWAQVNGYRGDTSISGRIEHDLYYIENWTMGFDFKILFLTFFKGFINKNAY